MLEVRLDFKVPSNPNHYFGDVLEEKGEEIINFQPGKGFFPSRNGFDKCVPLPLF